ncbi:hypothetical protein PGTUg99_028712 [Puccinia graminis f. sp. tritici]|uniref:Uncharacterized protein n=1 Tax=Puccinia graminis f. sp. tritici TaxID=56615 RepID=A0A5B0SAH1_PUCGR|nr:hypothetical protein PGTUg99_028712 [Puccinia graminis f. sp. tritici]
MSGPPSSTQSQSKGCVLDITLQRFWVINEQGKLLCTDGTDGLQLISFFNCWTHPRQVTVHSGPCMSDTKRSKASRIAFCLELPRASYKPAASSYGI